MDTVRLCSLLSNLAFTAVFLALWRGRREEGHLLVWGLSSGFYALVLWGFQSVSRSNATWLLPLLFIGLITTNLLIVSGIRALERQSLLHRWMPLAMGASVMAYALPQILGPALGWSGPQAVRTGILLGLILSVAFAGMLLLRDQGEALRGRRIAGFALLGYIPAYLCAIVAEIGGHGTLSLAVILPLLSDQVLLGILYLALLSMPGERAQRSLREAALRDPLTGAWNRAGMAAHRDNLARSGGALVMLDIDHFKAINDRHAHAVGDAVLVALARQAGALAADLGGWVVRLGGDEFVAVLPRATAEQGASMAQRMRDRIAAGGEGLPPHTVSLGLAMASPGEHSLTDALELADRRLYFAKAQGRNRLAV